MVFVGFIELKEKDCLNQDANNSELRIMNAE
jgi:hypothetical protein